MQSTPISIGELIASAWRNRALILKLARRDIESRYRGSFLGMFWSIMQPLSMLAVYTFFFGIVLKARWHEGVESKTEFALVLFAGLTLFNLLAENLSRAPGLILVNTNYVKKVVFPLEVLPWISFLSALFHMLISIGVLLFAYVVVMGMPHWTLVLVPLVIAPYALFIMGINWFLSATGVYVRDIGQGINLVQTALLFLSPVFYPLTSLSEEWRPWFYLNPLTFAIEQFRNLVIWGVDPSWGWLMVYWLLGIAFAWAGFAWFQLTRKGFSDVV